VHAQQLSYHKAVFELPSQNAVVEHSKAQNGMMNPKVQGSINTTGKGGIIMAAAFAAATVTSEC
jgi:hypothetical protein